ncbi:type A2 lanthipeptide [Cognatiluteimonas telluris]|jgi:hypothetical protein|uniref:type A2 lanthipeptide n=1 Tax=Cognatiluteimonas telluris TaxID=1104775 RepID=UPI00140C73B4|nr:type A2 lanthipeptide [Lysobacter telluris]
MNAMEVLTKWRNAEQDAGAVQRVAGGPAIDENLLQQIQGGIGSGYFPTISAECNGGTRCDNWSYWWSQMQSA